MTQQEYEQKRAECFEEFCKRYRIEEPSEQNIESFNWIFDRAYALGKQEKDADTVIQGWVARASDGHLALFKRKPDREIYMRSNNGLWFGGSMTELDSSLFPDLTWDSEPEEVEIIIKRKKK